MNETVEKAIRSLRITVKRHCAGRHIALITCNLCDGNGNELTASKEYNRSWNLGNPITHFDKHIGDSKKRKRSKKVKPTPDNRNNSAKRPRCDDISSNDCESSIELLDGSDSSNLSQHSAARVVADEPIGNGSSDIFTGMLKCIIFIVIELYNNPFSVHEAKQFK